MRILTRLTIAIAPALLIVAQQGNAQERYSGYAIIKPGATLDSGINQWITLDGKDCGETVLSTLGAVLEGTGYILAPPSESHPRIRDLYEQPVPSFIRSANGLYKLSDVLGALGGDGWRIKNDAVQRHISFDPVIEK